jgi:hypothetical protein
LLIAKEIDRIITNNKTEVNNLNNQLEDISAKYDKVEQFVAIEANLRSDLENTKVSLEKEKKDRLK